MLLLIQKDVDVSKLYVQLTINRREQLTSNISESSSGTFKNIQGTLMSAMLIEKATHVIKCSVAE